jgi:hypothetical protein
MPPLVRGDVVPAQHGVQVGLDDRQRVSQLVRGVVDELALSGECVVEPVQHAVDGVGEPAQLVVGLAKPDPPGQVGGGDLLGGRDDPAHRAQRPPGQPPADDEAAREQPCQRADGVDPQRVQRVVVDHPLDVGDLCGGERVDRDPAVLLVHFERLRHRLGIQAARQS